MTLLTAIDLEVTLVIVCGRAHPTNPRKPRRHIVVAAVPATAAWRGRGPFWASAAALLISAPTMATAWPSA
ncbi:hypothetical protein [Micromonospora coriariae]|uniref:hypothetical protein n=1 Tax=Micromonospora coriariae TaxID=285665 RepID=UPI0012FDC14D|nr:hypothetical protein [Micromonospora coriariae]